MGDALPDGVTAIVASVRAGRRTAAEVVDEHVDRCRASHGSLNALVQPRFDDARREAAAVPPGGPLAGVPVSVKECFPVRGLKTTLGIRSRSGCRDEADAAIVTRLRAAGAILLGKGNVPQAMYLHETDNPVWGRTIHPHAAERGPGGSSGGDAALVASGCVALAIGNDLAGSIRQPAHACGVAALLPRAAALGRGGAFETMPGLVGQRSRAGLLGRTVADVAAGWQAIGTVEAAPPPASLRVAWWDEAGPLEPSPAVRRGVRIAVEQLRAAGARVERLDAATAAEAAWIHLALVSADGGNDVRSLFGGERPIPPVERLLALAGFHPVLRRILAGACVWTGRGIEGAALRRTGPRRGRRLARALADRAGIEAVVEAWRDHHDVIVCPVSALPALRHGTAASLVVAAAPCLLANLVDLAAGSVPVTRVEVGEERGRPWSPDPVRRLARRTDEGSAGLPIGVQVVALDRRPGVGEAVVLEAMRAIAAGVSPAVSR